VKQTPEEKVVERATAMQTDHCVPPAHD